METRPSKPRQLPLLPDDTIAEILSWLPVKPLLRFSCVSRSWKSIISDPKFVKLHLQRSPRNPNVIMMLQSVDDETDMCAAPCSVRSLLNIPPSTVSLDGCDPLPLEDTYWVLGSCNGLVCLVAPTSWLEDTIQEHWFEFWNPATRVRSGKSPSLFVDLQVHPLGTTKLGFGCDVAGDTYKVVAILSDVSRNTQVKVHTMGDTCWRDIGSFPALPCQGYNEGVYTSGTLNWFAIHKLSICSAWDNALTVGLLVIVSLDLGKETYKELALPMGLNDLSDAETNLGVLMDCLCMYVEYKRSRFVLWQMKEFGDEKSWTKLVNVSYEHLQIVSYLPSELYDNALTVTPVCLSENGHIVLVTNDEDMEVILYNFKNDIVERARVPNNKIWINPKGYIQSLVMPL